MDFIPSGNFELSDEEFSAIFDKAKKCFPIFERHLGKDFVLKYKHRLRNIVYRACIDPHQDIPGLAQTKRELTDILKYAQKLHDKLKELGGPAEQELDRALFTEFLNSYSYHPEFEKGLPGELQDTLLYLKILAQKSLDSLPSKGRWPKEFNIEKELIKDLGVIFEKATGKNPDENLHHEPLRVESGVEVLKDQVRYYYAGDFFNLVEDITLTLNTHPKRASYDEFSANQSLGKMIERSLYGD